MKKTLTAIALFAALTAGAATTANASMPAHAAHNEGLQNYYYYFGAPCCNKPMGMAAAAPCGAPVAAAPACGNPCEPCMVPIQYEQVCTTCDPCGSSFNVLNPFSYFG
ncbi:MAG: hypothetical protein H0X26_09205 [Alphaproteobacteria bacterium]|nr:hypothetical protein [Alphaproteobacteria bacterium]